MKTRLTLLALAALALLAIASSPAHAQWRHEAVQAGRDDPINGFDELPFVPERDGYLDPNRRGLRIDPDSRLDGGTSSGPAIESLNAPAYMYTAADRKSRYEKLPNELARMFNANLAAGWQARLQGPPRRNARTGRVYVEMRPIARIYQPAPDGSGTVALLGPAVLESR